MASTPLDYRNATLTNGAATTLITANNGTIPLAASLGVPTTQSSRIAILEFYNGGATVMGWSNIAGGVKLDETNLLSPTTISVGATSSSTVYSASAVSANSPYRVVGWIDAIWTSGTGWTISEVQPAGGKSLDSIGNTRSGQSWAALSISSGVPYVNRGILPITISIYSGTNGVGTVFINGFLVTSCSGTEFLRWSGDIYPGDSVTITGTFTVAARS